MFRVQGRRRWLAAAMLATAMAFVSAPAMAQGDGKYHALIVGGLPGSEVYAKRYRDWITRFHKQLADAGVPAKGIAVLSADKDFSAPFVRHATADSVKKAFEEVAVQAAQNDHFLLILIGHGVTIQDPPTFVLKGRDLTAPELAALLDTVKARQQVVLNFSASSGRFLKYLSKEGRVNLAATSPLESNEPVLAEFFLRGLESKAADGWGGPTPGPADGTVTLLEAYNWSVYNLAEWMGRQKAMVNRTEHKVTPRGDWKVDGQEATMIFQKLYSGAETELGAARMAPESDPAAADEIVEIKPPDGRPTPEKWDTRRMLPEQAVLEDCGVEAGASALTPWIAKEGAAKPDAAAAAYDPADGGFRPLDGKNKGEPGYLARRIVLGKTN